MYRVWIVEDETSLRKAEVKYVEKQGYLVSGFPDAESALDRLGEEVPSIVFLDLRLPGMTGEELMERVHSRSPDTVVIIVSAYSDSQKDSSFHLEEFEEPLNSQSHLLHFQ